MFFLCSGFFLQLITVFSVHIPVLRSTNYVLPPRSPQRSTSLVQRDTSSNPWPTFATGELSPNHSPVVDLRSPSTPTTQTPPFSFAPGSPTETFYGGESPRIDDDSPRAGGESPLTGNSDAAATSAVHFSSSSDADEQTTATTSATNKRRRYISVRRPVRSVRQRIGKKRHLSQDDDRLQQLYLENCCQRKHIRQSFSVEAFLAKRRAYGELGSEIAKSRFIDTMLDNALRTTEDNHRHFEFFVNGIQLPAPCLCHLYGFSRTKLEARMQRIIPDAEGHIQDAATASSRQRVHGNAGSQSHRTTSSLNVPELIASWIQATLEGLVDTFQFEYLPCYIKPSDLHGDYIKHLQVIFVACFVGFFFPVFVVIFF